MSTSVDLTGAPRRIAETRLFTVGTTDFKVADVVRHVGDLDRPPAHRSAREVEEEFRRDRRLLTADQLTTWLETWAIAPEQFVAWTAGRSDPSADPWTTMICSGSLDRAATMVAAEAAAACALGAPPDTADAFEPVGWIDRLVTNACRPSIVEALVRRHRVDWTAVRTRSVVCARRPVAEELRHWIIEDGISLEVAALQAGLRLGEFDGLLVDLRPTSLLAALAGTRPGDLVGPLVVPGGWALVLVVARREPSAEDSTTFTRARDEIRAQLVRSAVGRYVGT